MILEGERKRALQAIFGVVWLSIFLSILHWGWTETWNALLVPTMWPPFADLRGLQGALLTLSNGLDPYVQNPGDPWGRVLNYPSHLVSAARFLRIDNEFNYLIFCFFMIATFIGGLFITLRRFPSFFLLAGILSSSTLLAVERANNDIFVFSLVCFGCFLSPGARLMLISFAAYIKLYPAAAFFAPGRSLKFHFLSLILVLCLVMVSLDDFSKIVTGTPSTYWLSYGFMPSYIYFQHVLGGPFYIEFWVLGFLFGMVLTWKLAKRFWGSSLKDASSAQLSLFYAGGGVFCGTFLLMSSFDYRLIFLLMIIPAANLSTSTFPKILFVMSTILAVNFPVCALAGDPGLLVNFLAKIFCFYFVAWGLIFSLQDEVKRLRGLREAVRVL